MKKIGILAFYINVGNIAPEDCEEFIQTISEEMNEKDKNLPLSLWQNIFIPIRTGESRVQVIRNDGQVSNDEIVLSELKDKLEKFEEFSLKKSYNPNSVIGDYPEYVPDEK